VHSVGCLQEAVSGDSLSPSGEWPQPNLAARTVRSPNSGNTNAVFHGFILRTPNPIFEGNSFPSRRAAGTDLRECRATCNYPNAQSLHARYDVIEAIFHLIDFGVTSMALFVLRQ
jgi:hypothetical protein